MGSFDFLILSIKTESNYPVYTSKIIPDSLEIGIPKYPSLIGSKNFLPYLGSIKKSESRRPICFSLHPS